MKFELLRFYDGFPPPSHPAQVVFSFHPISVLIFPTNGFKSLILASKLDSPQKKKRNEMQLLNSITLLQKLDFFWNMQGATKSVREVNITGGSTVDTYQFVPILKSNWHAFNWFWIFQIGILVLPPLTLKSWNFFKIQIENEFFLLSI